jgi:hypothetical protein
MRRPALLHGAALAAGVLLTAGPATPAHAQRAASVPSTEDAGGPAPAPPPPPGFPAPLGNDLVYGGELETHLQSDFVSSTGNKTHVSLFNDTDVTGFVNYKGWLSLNAEGKLERNRDDNADSFYVDRNAIFRSEGATLRQVFATVRPVEGLSVYGGKIHPNFGSAYDQAPGQFYNFGTDYEQDERIGFGVQYAIALPGPELLGLNGIRVALETFFLDTSVLSSSIFSRPGLDDPTADRLRRYTRDQFGPSNTGSFDSYTLSVRGGRPERGLAWQISFTQEATADPSGRTERGQSIGGSYDPNGDGIPITSRLGVTPYLEYAHFSNFQGIAGLERHYAVGGLQFTYARWQASLAAGLRRSAGAATGTDHQENATLTYEVIPRLLLGGGINFINVGGRSSVALSPALNYVRAF